MAKRGFDAFVGAMLGSGIGAAVAVYLAQPGADADFAVKGPPMVVGAFWFFAKCFTLIFFMIWLRWTLPRYRVDQLMDLCWKKLTPLALVNLVAIGILETRHEWMALLFGKGGAP
jgi:NADH:ubiquinone oxidoreductase subunit H